MKRGSLRKGQAAIEFLMTYGWAMGIMLLALSALAYFGFTNPQAALPPRCEFGNNIACLGSQIILHDAVDPVSMEIRFALFQTAGQTIYDVNADFDATGTVTGSCVPVNTDMGVDDKLTLTCTTLDVDRSRGDRVKYKFQVGYKTTQTGYDHVSLGEITGVVQ